MSENTLAEQDALIGALTFYLESGVSDFCMAEASDMSAWEKAPLNILKPVAPPMPTPSALPQVEFHADIDDDAPAPLGKAEVIAEVTALLEKIDNVDALRDALTKFDGLSIKKTASNLVFAEGHKDAPIMIISEFPQADEDMSGTPFAGVNRKLIDYALSGVARDITSDDASKAVYTTSLLNWRPPGSRSPQDVELEVSRLILDKHIALVKPKAIFMLGNIVCKKVLGCKTNINKLRGNWQSYKPECAPELTIPVMPSYHPSALLAAPKNKRLFWSDLLQIKAKLAE
ncbi:MAG: uracil-DNA glycosylase [Pseudomonadota bacterium]|nr:uracil-DNA glycosylase [Pseudomonadota bacterium]MED5422506.1 uracil-DNA glycosylase [Pseudomonadota bacterium]MEE3323476.1 uracil-DNA glycosylase [Pseudomonadota bacterium]